MTSPTLTVSDRPEVDHQDGPLAEHLLADIASGFAAATDLWQSVARHDRDVRPSTRLVATERYEVWVIGWTEGQRVEFHDHGPSRGHIVVVDGELTELRLGHQELAATTLPTGSSHTVPVGTVHDVVNLDPTPAISIHVYSPPLSSMTYYDAATHDPYLTRRVDSPEPDVDARGASRLLHPSVAP